jgi:hypothetical protein
MGSMVLVEKRIGVLQAESCAAGSGRRNAKTTQHFITIVFCRMDDAMKQVLNHIGLVIR